MNVRVFWVCAMKCMCAQTRPRLILSSERVFGGIEFEPMLTPREKSPLPENLPRGGLNPRRCGQRTQTPPTSYSGPLSRAKIQYTRTLAHVAQFAPSHFFPEYTQQDSKEDSFLSYTEKKHPHLLPPSVPVTKSSSFPYVAQDHKIYLLWNKIMKSTFCGTRPQN